MNYYNEFDANAAAWLRQLIAEGLIPPGDVDQRSITDVRPTDLSGYTQCHFFCGIGGWNLALALAGWPADRPVWTGSCPCQPFSVAGKGKGADDERHLWPAFFNLIRECRPQHVFGEQVESAIAHGWLDGIRADLEGEGYACGDATLGAHSLSAPHIRQRLYWVANASGDTGPQHEREPGSELRRKRARQTAQSVEAIMAGWPSPNANNIKGTCQSPEAFQRRKEKGQQQNLQDVVTLAGWPTASARDWKDTAGMATTGTNPDGTERSRLDQLPRVAQLVAGWVSPTATDGSRGSLPPRPQDTGVPLSQQVCLVGWTTPSASDAQRGGTGITEGMTGSSLAQLAKFAGWPTPLCVPDSPASHGQLSGQYRKAMEQAYPATLGVIASGFSVEIPNTDGFQLNPFFSLWLMGFHPAWALAGLKALRKMKLEQSAARPVASRSRKKSPSARNSSKEPETPSSPK